MGKFQSFLHYLINYILIQGKTTLNLSEVFMIESLRYFIYKAFLRNSALTVSSLPQPISIRNTILNNTQIQFGKEMKEPYKRSLL